MSRFKFEMCINNSEKPEEPKEQKSRIHIDIKITDDGPLVVEHIKHYEAAIKALAGAFGLYRRICRKTERKDLNLGEIYRSLWLIGSMFSAHNVYPFKEISGEEAGELVMCFVKSIEKHLENCDGYERSVNE
jgi:hypothetical protein